MRRVNDDKEKVYLETVIFVPSTRGGILVRKLRDRDETLAGITGFGVRLQEAVGTRLMNMFNTNLGKGLHCGRTPYPPCETINEAFMLVESYKFCDLDQPHANLLLGEKE